MRISMIMAMDVNRLIGKDGGMPWHISADLKYFKRITMGKPVIMGRRTFDSLGKPLPGRPNIVITRSKDFLAVHVHNDFSFANKVDDFYYKVEVTNRSSGNRTGTWFRSELLSNPEYNAALQAQPFKPGYTDKLRVKLGGNGAF